MNTPQTPTLWDMYAMHALQGVISLRADITVAQTIYEACLYADAMLKESQKRRDAE